MHFAAAARLLPCPSKKQPPDRAYKKLCLVLVLTGLIIGNAYAETETEADVPYSDVEDIRA